MARETLTPDGFTGDRGDRFFTGFLNALAALGVLAIAAFLASVIGYTRFSGYLDHAEPGLAAVSSRLLHGLHLFPADLATPPHSLYYGPLFYLLPAVAIEVLGDAISGPKAVSTAAAGLALLLLTLVFRSESSWRLALIHGGAVALALLALRQSSFAARPESQVFLIVTLAIAAGTLASSRVAAILTGALLGIAIGLKINTAVVFLPLLGLLRDRGGWRELPFAAGAAAACALAPFLHSQVSLPGFLARLTVAVGHGPERARFVEIVLASLLLVVPLCLAAAALRRTARAALSRELRAGWAFWASIPVTILLVIAIGSKRGSGSSHLVALWPVVGYALLRLSRLFTAETALPFRPLPRAAAAAATAVTAVVLFAAAVQGQRNVWGNYRTYHAYYAQVRRDIERLLADNPGRAFAIGFADGRLYESTWIRCELIRRGHPYLLEPISLMDLQAAGMAVDLPQVIASPGVDAWLFPAGGGRPFSMPNIYPTGRILPESFEERFLAAWEPAGRTAAFEVRVRKKAGGQ